MITVASSQLPLRTEDPFDYEFYQFPHGDQDRLHLFSVGVIKDIIVTILLNI